MQKPTKIVLVPSALLLAGGVVLVVFLLSLDPTDHKEWIVGKFEQRAGWQLTLEGDVAYTLYP